MWRYVFFFIFTMLQVDVFATHLRSGEITYERVNCDSREVIITLTIYVDTGSDLLPGMGILRFGDGEYVNLEGLDVTQVPGYEDVGVAVYSVNHVYAMDGLFQITYTEPNRNIGIVNFPSSASVQFHVSTLATVKVGNEYCNSSPELTIQPVDVACAGQTFFHIPGAIDPDGDSLVYRFVVPQSEVDREIRNYADLLEWTGEGEEGTPPEFRLDPYSGLITWDTPSQQGEFVIAIAIEEYRMVDGKYELIGMVIRDMQILVFDCLNKRPDIFPTLDTCIVAGTTFEKPLFGVDPDGDSIRLEVFGEVKDEITIEGKPAQSNPAEWQIGWSPVCSDARSKPYEIIFKARDQPIDGPPLVDFETWRIRVIPPAPVPRETSLSSNGISITWEPYSENCDIEADRILIYRKVSGFRYDPDPCEIGVRRSTGYEYIGEVSGNTTQFLDDDLIPAAKLCYRLVAVLPNGSVGKVSTEICHEFVPIDKPVITNVSVIETSESTGKVLVAWRRPLDFPAPEAEEGYMVLRRTHGSGDFEVVSGDLPIYSWEDSIGYIDNGLNTLETVYEYRVALQTETNLLYSAEATTVRLQVRPTQKEFTLEWSAATPWSNIIEGYPHFAHKRDEEGADSQYDIDISDGFFWIDERVEAGSRYCYRIQTAGSYGNPILPITRNFSQWYCTMLSDTIPPEIPQIATGGDACDRSSFTHNEIRWDSIQSSDIAAFQIYYKPDIESDFTLLEEVTSYSYFHAFDSVGSRISIKGCYKVRAIDISGNVGGFSEEICFDHCPQFELPNVFTPNDDGCNDVFAAESPEDSVCGGEAWKARHVQNVKITIFNRWGKSVYSSVWYRNEENERNYWDGRDNNGLLVSSGLYFYTAEYEFDVLDATQRKGEIKGWVHLLR